MLYACVHIVLLKLENRVLVHWSPKDENANAEDWFTGGDFTGNYVILVWHYIYRWCYVYNILKSTATKTDV